MYAKTTCGMIILSLLLSIFSPAQAGDLKPFYADSYRQIIDQQQQPILLVLWSLDCPPCREEMPELAEFSQHHPELNLVMVSVDGVEMQDEVSKVLDQYHLNDIDQWLFADSFVEKLRYKIDPGWQGELPRSYLIVPGEQRHRIRGRIDFLRLEQYLKSFATK